MPLNPIQSRIGNYHHCGDVFKRKADKQEFFVGFATAYNAFGLIGSECNGIFVLNTTKRDVVLDEHMRVDSGWFGAKPEHLAELKRLQELSEEDFLAWVHSHPRARDQYRR